MSRPEALDHLEILLGLPKVNVRITGVHMFGSGSRAAVRIDLDNSEQMLFDNVREMTKPAALRSELVACTGSVSKITADQAVQAVAHVRSVAARTLAVTEDGTAVDWAHSYLTAATTLDLDMGDMRQRFAAFERLERNRPWDRARTEGLSLASAAIVLRGQDGTRYVRAGWFAAYVRQQDATIGQAALAVRMARIGWQRRGSAGNINARSAATGTHHVWSFYDVPTTWDPGAEDDPPRSPEAPGIGTTRARKPDTVTRVEGASEGFGASRPAEAP